MGYSDEFPSLKPLGLYAANIVGDGNCLFNALSDQLYGNQERHREIRLRTVAWMRDHKLDFTPFLDVLPGGATRRNPKRKNARGYSNYASALPSPEEVDRAFEDRLCRMAQGGTYGDNMEIVAFTSAYMADVIVVQTDKSYFISGPRGEHLKHTCCIAYHEWEHYSSVRNVDGPHIGPPQLKLSDLTTDELAPINAPVGPINVPNWQIQLLMNSVQFPIDESTAVTALEDSRGNLDDAVSRLMEDNQYPDYSSSVYSSSVEPQLPPSVQVDDYSSMTAPNKKQDRRMSRASKSVSRTRERRHREQLYEKLSSSSLEQLERATTASVERNAQRRRFTRVILDDEDTEMEDNTTPPPLYDGSTSSESDYSVTTSPPKPLTIKLSLKPPQQSASNENSFQFSPPGHKPLAKATQSKKPLSAARDKKNLKKQAQKQAAKERRQAASKPDKESSSLSFPPPNSSSQSSVSNGFRLLHV